MDSEYLLLQSQIFLNSGCQQLIFIFQIVLDFVSQIIKKRFLDIFLVLQLHGLISQISGGIGSSIQRPVVFHPILMLLPPLLFNFFNLFLQFFQFGLGGITVFVSALFVDLFVDVFYLNLHIYNFGLEIKRIVEFEGSHYLFIVFLLFELPVDEEDKLFVADCSV